MVGILSRQNVAKTIALSASYANKTLQILVENQGRINHNVMNDFKGLGDVKLDNKMLENWTLTGFPLSDASQIDDLISESDDNDINLNDYSHHLSHFNSDVLISGPIIYHATFNVDQTKIHDTYLNPQKWGKVNKHFIIYCFVENKEFGTP